MFNVFKGNGNDNDLNEKDRFGERILQIIESNSFITGTASTMYNMLGSDAVKDLEGKVAQGLYNQLNESKSQGEALIISVMILLHCCHVIEDLEDEYNKWRGDPNVD